MTLSERHKQLKARKLEKVDNTNMTQKEVGIAKLETKQIQEQMILAEIKRIILYVSKEKQEIEMLKIPFILFKCQNYYLSQH